MALKRKIIEPAICLYDRAPDDINSPIYCELLLDYVKDLRCYECDENNGNCYVS